MKYQAKYIVVAALVFGGLAPLGAAEIHEAAAGGNLASVTRLIAADRRVVRAKTATQVTPLHYAAIRGNVAIARALIEAGADVGARTEDGKTPLQFVFDNPEVQDEACAALTELLASGSDLVNSVDGNGLTPLHQAARLGNAAAADVLIRRGALVGARDAKGNTPLHLIAEATDTAEAVATGKRLISAGASVNAANHVGATPLHAVAVSDTSYEAVALFLLRAGADPLAKDAIGQTPRQAAIAAGNFAVAAFIAEEERKAGRTASQPTSLPVASASFAASSAAPLPK
ncbi:MAG TPA: ankyrin repeat domain-containing protein [Candidatus Ozemobacteraceae bacterium]|nr:ankyrin repeat domain-containing protein [Candidatus Ozemobacteraceae bacterium]